MRSEPTVWDGDSHTHQHILPLLFHVLSPLRGMETLAKPMALIISTSLVLSPPCGMETLGLPPTQDTVHTVGSKPTAWDGDL